MAVCLTPARLKIKEKTVLFCLAVIGDKISAKITFVSRFNVRPRVLAGLFVDILIGFDLFLDFYDKF